MDGRKSEKDWRLLSERVPRQGWQKRSGNAEQEHENEDEILLHKPPKKWQKLERQVTVLTLRSGPARANRKKT